MQGIFLLHMPKCAGTTVWHALGRLYGRDRVFRVGTPVDRRLLEEMSAEQRRAFAVLGGHGSLSHFRQYIDDIDQRYRMTVVREPVDRIISEYEFIRRQPAHPRHAAVSAQTLLQFGRSPEVVNLQSRLICGRQDAAAALNVLETQFDEVGTIEDVGAMINAAFRRRGRRLEKLPRKNAGAARPVVDQATLDALAEVNAVDVALYDAVLRSKRRGVLPVGSPVMDRDKFRAEPAPTASSF